MVYELLAGRHSLEGVTCIARSCYENRPKVEHSSQYPSELKKLELAREVASRVAVEGT